MPVYFVQAVEGGGAIKIGHAADVGARLKQLEAHYGQPLALLATIPGGRKEERAVHLQFSGLRFGRTEQFHPDPALLAFIHRPLFASPTDVVEVMEPGFRTVGFRASREYVEWLTGMAKLDRLTVSQFIDKAVTERARQLDPTKPPPERIP